jgi:hypothetical protein
MEDLNDLYETILNPLNFVEYFKTMDEFRMWASEGDILDLEEAIKVFEKYELYEHCAVMLELLNEKKLKKYCK